MAQDRIDPKMTAAVDEAMDFGMWVCEDPGRLQSYLKGFDKDQAGDSIARFLSMVAAGMSRAHVKTGEARTAMEVMAQAAFLAVKALDHAKEGGQ